MQQRLHQAAALTVALAACSPGRENVWQGYVEGEYVSVSSSQSGRLDRLSVVRGQQIAIGAALFELESGDETAAREQAQRQLQTAQAQLADIQSGKRPQEVGVTQAQLLQAQATARKAQLQLARDETQYRTGGIARQQLDDSRSAAETSATRVSTRCPRRLGSKRLRLRASVAVSATVLSAGLTASARLTVPRSPKVRLTA